MSVRVPKSAAVVRAFTLIELLVVTAIIAILIAILLPTVSFARERGRIARCLSNVRTASAAYRMYINAHDSKGLGFSGSPGGAWFMILDPYGMSDGNRICPSVTEFRNEKGHRGAGAAFMSWSGNAYDSVGALRVLSKVQNRLSMKIYTGSYGFNGWLYTWGKGQYDLGPTGQPFAGRMPVIEMFGNPARGNETRIPCFGDCTWIESWPRLLPAEYAALMGYSTDNHAIDPVPTIRGQTVYDPNGIQDDSANCGNYMGMFSIDRHGGHTVNTSFIDGHAENLKLKRLWKVQWSVHSMDVDESFFATEPRLPG